MVNSDIFMTRQVYKVSTPTLGHAFLIFSNHSTGEGNGTHSSTLAWKIPWTEELGRLQSMGSLRVGHD